MDGKKKIGGKNFGRRKKKSTVDGRADGRRIDVRTYGRLDVLSPDVWTAGRADVRKSGVDGFVNEFELRMLIMKFRVISAAE